MDDPVMHAHERIDQGHGLPGVGVVGDEDPLPGLLDFQAGSADLPRDLAVMRVVPGRLQKKPASHEVP